MRYYSAKADCLVTRYGTGTYIGATVAVIQEGPDKGQTKITHDEKVIVGIPDGEYAIYAREYRTLVAEGSLIVRDQKDWDALLKTEADAQKKELAEREAAAKVAAKAEADAQKKAAAAG